MPRLSDHISQLIENFGWQYELSGSIFTIRMLCGDSVRISLQPNANRSFVDLPQTWRTALIDRYAGIQTVPAGHVLWENNRFESLFSFFSDQDDSECCSSGGKTLGGLTSIRQAARDVVALRNSLKKISNAEREAEIHVRNGQAILKKLLMAEIGHCIITGITESVLLKASHIIPWKHSCHDSLDCLNPENVLLLAANYDALFDPGYISFDAETGSLIKSISVSEETLCKLGVDVNVKIPVHSRAQAEFLRWHNKNWLKQ